MSTRSLQTCKDTKRCTLLNGRKQGAALATFAATARRERGRHASRRLCVAVAVVVARAHQQAASISDRLSQRIRLNSQAVGLRKRTIVCCERMDKSAATKQSKAKVRGCCTKRASPLRHARPPPAPATAHQRVAAQAKKPAASEPTQDDLDAAFAALADHRGVITAASLHAKACELNLGWDEEDSRSMLQLFGAGRSASRDEFAAIAAQVKARKPKG